MGGGVAENGSSSSQSSLSTCTGWCSEADSRGRLAAGCQLLGPSFSKYCHRRSGEMVLLLASMSAVHRREAGLLDLWGYPVCWEIPGEVKRACAAVTCCRLLMIPRRRCSREDTLQRRHTMLPGGQRVCGLGNAWVTHDGAHVTETGRIAASSDNWTVPAGSWGYRHERNAWLRVCKCAPWSECVPPGHGSRTTAWTTLTGHTQARTQQLCERLVRQRTHKMADNNLVRITGVILAAYWRSVVDHGTRHYKTVVASPPPPMIVE